MTNEDNFLREGVISFSIILSLILVSVILLVGLSSVREAQQIKVFAQNCEPEPWRLKSKFCGGLSGECPYDSVAFYRRPNECFGYQRFCYSTPVCKQNGYTLKSFVDGAMYKIGEYNPGLDPNYVEPSSKVRQLKTSYSGSRIRFGPFFRVWARAVSGRIVAESRVSGAKIVVVGGQLDFNSPLVLRTDAQGMVYLEEDLQPGDYLATVTKEGYYSYYKIFEVKPSDLESLEPMEAIPINTQRPTLQPTPTFQPVQPTPTADPIFPTPTIDPTPGCPRKSEGDANCDGVINVLDFSIWRREKYDLGADEIQGEWQADFNGDGYVRNDDFSIWLNNLD